MCSPGRLEAVSRSITERVVFDLSHPGAPSAGGEDSFQWDIAINGMPWLCTPRDDHPYIRETAPIRRDRVDQEREPGEQTLDGGVWLRSQTSWHLGAGQEFAEPLESDPAIARFRFHMSGGVDVFTRQGEVSLLRDTVLLYPTSSPNLRALGVEAGVVMLDGGKVVLVSGLGGSRTLFTSANALICLATDGRRWFASDEDAIFYGDVLSTGAAGSVAIPGVTTMGWVKDRLMVGAGNALYEVTDLTEQAPTPLKTSNSPDLIWVDVDEGPDNIYAASVNGQSSHIWRLGSYQDGESPVLTPPTVVLSMPRGEIVRSIYGYLGSYMAISTTLGMRIAEVGQGGELTLGPVSVPLPGGALDMVGFDRFLYVASCAEGVQPVPGSPVGGMWRLDLSANTAPGRFAYASDMAAPDGSALGTVTAVTTVGDKVVFTVDGQGLYAPADTFRETGWIDSSVVSMGTMEPKAWTSMSVNTSGSGSLTVRVGKACDGTVPETMVIGEMPMGEYPDLSIGGDLTTTGPTMFTFVQLTNGDTTTTPSMDSWQVRAVPVPKRNRYIQFPLLCFDFEVDRNQNRIGWVGGAIERLSELERTEALGAVVMVEDSNSGERYRAVIDKVSFERTTPPQRGFSGFGGVVTVTVLRVD